MALDPYTAALVAVLKGLTKILSLTPKEFPPCHPKAFRGTRNLPFGKITLVHCTEDGDFTLQPLQE